MSESNDDRPSDSLAGLSRRELLALTGTGAAALAGCSGGEGGTDSPASSPTESPTATPTNAPTQSPTDAASPTATPTATSSPTDSPTPTATPSTQERMAQYGCPNLDRDGDYDAVVAEDGSGDFESVQAAVDSLEPRTFEEQRVFIEPGRYREKLTVPESLSDVTFLGENPQGTVITYDDHADKTGEDGEPIGTSGSSSVFVDCLDFTAANITFANGAEPVAQAVAMRPTGDRAMFYNCRFVGNQDTLYTRGKQSNQYYSNCYIEGDVDFIFGAATSYFDSCEIFCKDDGYVTAASTVEDRPYGYVFNNCTIYGDAPPRSVYLGRPWQRYAQTVFLNSYMGEVIKPVGYEPWDEPNHPDKTKTVYYAEYNNEGPGYEPGNRPDWVHQLSEEEAQPYTDVTEIFRGWNPEACL